MDSNRQSRLVGDMVRRPKGPGVVPEILKPPVKRRARPKVPMRALAGAVFVIVVAGVFVFFALPEAAVKVSVRGQPVARDLEVRVDVRQSEINSAELAIPGRLVERQIAGSGSYPATGKKNIGKTASGFVQIYNFSKETLILRSDTTALTAAGRGYGFTQDVSGIRPTAFVGLEDQEIDESSLIAPVPVAASGPGEEFNLAAGTRVEIENEVFGRQPQILYGVVTGTGITGGSTNEVPVVSQADIAAAFDALSQELISRAQSEMQENGSNFKLLDSAVVSEVMSQETSANAGAETARFDASMTMGLRALVYDENNVRDVVVERIARLLPDNQKLEAGGFERLESRFMLVNLEDGSGILRSHFESEIRYQVDRQELAARIKGKTASEIGEILLSRPEIAGVEVEFYPFWVKKAPRFSGKINIELLYPGQGGGLDG